MYDGEVPRRCTGGVCGVSRFGLDAFVNTEVGVTSCTTEHKKRVLRLWLRMGL
jgi:hypothetical protein